MNKHNPYPRTGQKLTHRIIAEQAYGGLLPPKSEVHHVDGNQQNNRPGNLVICQNRAYHFLLHQRQRVLDAGGNPNTDKLCSKCDTPKALGEFAVETRCRDGRHMYCKPCDAKYQRQRRASCVS